MTPTQLHPNIVWLDEVDSTNSELRKRKSGLDNLSVISVERQNSGRGQGTHTWFSSPGKNLTFSILYRHNALDAKDAILVTCVTTLALRDYLLEHGVEARIKWPNDIWVGEKKICGILIENTVETGMIAESIVGIGLNLNETGWPSELPNPVSLCELTGKTYAPHTELENLCNAICRRFALLGSDDGRMSLQEEFGKYMFRLP